MIVFVICPDCDADIMTLVEEIKPQNRCPFCRCLYRLLRKDEFKPGQFYTTQMLKEGVKKK